MIRLYHVSDVHFHGDREDNNAAIKLLAKVRRNFETEDYLLVTGDIADDGREDQYKNALKALAPFSPRIFACPGNHDYGNVGNIYQPKCAQYFDTVFLPAVGRSKGFINKVPVVDELDDGKGTQLLLIGLNSNLETASVDDFARGQIGRDQLLALDAILEDARHAGKHKLVYLHHRPQKCSWFLELTDSEDLLACVANRIDLLAFGHSGGEMKDKDAPQAKTMQVIRREFGVKYLLNANSSVDNQLFFEIIFDGPNVQVALKPDKAAVQAAPRAKAAETEPRPTAQS